MPPIDKRKILKSLEKDFRKGQIVFAEGEETRELYILLQGEVEIRKNDRTIAVVREGDTYLGEMSTLLGTPRTATLIAASDCRMICVPENKVTDFFAHSPALGIKLAKVLAQRLQEMNIKYERMLADVVQDEDAAKPLFEQITANAYRRAFLALWKDRVGGSVSIKEVVTGLDVPLAEINRLLMDFTAAGLVRVEDRTIHLLEAENRALRQMIMHWAP